MLTTCVEAMHVACCGIGLWKNAHEDTGAVVVSGVGLGMVAGSAFVATFGVYLGTCLRDRTAGRDDVVAEGCHGDNDAGGPDGAMCRRWV